MSDNTVPNGDVHTLPTWRVILDMIRYRWKLWLVNLGALLILIAFWQIPGFVMAESFDLLTGDHGHRAPRGARRLGDPSRSDDYGLERVPFVVGESERPPAREDQ